VHGLAPHAVARVPARKHMRARVMEQLRALGRRADAVASVGARRLAEAAERGAPRGISGQHQARGRRHGEWPIRKSDRDSLRLTF
jgi:hypothetical protein